MASAPIKDGGLPAGIQSDLVRIEKVFNLQSAIIIGPVLQATTRELTKTFECRRSQIVCITMAFCCIGRIHTDAGEWPIDLSTLWPAVLETLAQELDYLRVFPCWKCCHVTTVSGSKQSHCVTQDILLVFRCNVGSIVVLPKVPYAQHSEYFFISHLSPFHARSLEDLACFNLCFRAQGDHIRPLGCRNRQMFDVCRLHAVLLGHDHFPQLLELLVHLGPPLLQLLSSQAFEFQT
mmetsp:Transcript_108384/g.203418  ORF Transcript_108384/g.203418 Transcript_108384/m.203418 type:complete len:235 (-) Transcript_108384:458-1162(-)